MSAQAGLRDTIKLVVKAYSGNEKEAQESREDISHGFGIYMWGVYQV